MIRWVVVIVYVLTMFIYAGQESSGALFTAKLITKFLPHLDRAQIRTYVLILRKTGHVMAYGILTLLVYGACRKTKKMQKWSLLFAVVFSFLVAVGDEFYQRYLAHRTGSWNDVVIDGVGIGLASLVIGLRVVIKAKKKTASDVAQYQEETGEGT